MFLATASITAFSLTACNGGGTSNSGATSTGLSKEQKHMLEEARFDNVIPIDELDELDDENGPMNFRELKQTNPALFESALNNLGESRAAIISDINAYMDYQDEEDEEDSEQMNSRTNGSIINNKKINSQAFIPSPVGPNATYVRCYAKAYYNDNMGNKVQLPFPTAIIEPALKWLIIPGKKVTLNTETYAKTWVLNDKLNGYVKLNIRQATKGDFENSHQTYYFSGTTMAKLKEQCVNTLTQQMNEKIKEHDYKIPEFKLAKDKIKFENVVIRGADNDASYDHPLVLTKNETKTKEGTFVRMISFGDSLSDTDATNNIFQWKIPERSTWMAGHFTNGWTWAEYAADSLGIEPHNEAFGAAGASSVTLNQLNGWLTLVPGNLLGYYIPGFIPVQYTAYTPAPIERTAFSQFELFEKNIVSSQQNENLPNNTLYTVLIGGNDFVNYNKAPTDVINGVDAAVSNLVEKQSAKYIVVLNLPEEIGSAPIFSGEKKGIKDEVIWKVKNYDSRLPGLVNELNQKYKAQGVQIKLFDTSPVFADIVHNPSKYGINDTVNTCLINPSATYVSSSARKLSCTGYNYVYWDTLHPTTKTHQILGEKFADFIRTEYPDKL